MNKTDMNRLIIEATVRHTLERLSEAPEREIRNLIDMGMAFSEGRFQKQIFATAQTMLQNPDSAYYDLVKYAAGHIDHERLLQVGMNIGYESCTKGAGTIRAIEAQEQFNIPWALTLSINTDKPTSFYESVLAQSTALGIYTTLLFVDEIESAIPLLKSEPQIAFVLFVRSSAITDEALAALTGINNVMICVADDDHLASACEKLYHAHMIYGIYHLYNEGNSSLIISEAWLESLLTYHPSFVVLAAEEHCPSAISDTVYTFTRRMREEQRYPFVLMALQQDLQLIDKIISDDLCMVGFDKTGALHTVDGRSDNPIYNIFNHPLADILKDALKK